MVAVKKTIEVCDRDPIGRETPATAERIFALDDRYYELKLCEKHAEMFDRDLSGWTRLAAEIDSPAASAKRSVFFTAEIKAETARIKELAERANRVAAIEKFAQQRAAEIEAEAQAEQHRALERAAADRAVQEAEQQRLAALAAILPPREPTVEEQHLEEERRAFEAVRGAPGWRMTFHAREKMWERGFTPIEVLGAAVHPEATYSTGAWRGEHAANVRLHRVGLCCVVVDPSKKAIVTVMDRDTSTISYDNPSERKAQ